MIQQGTSLDICDKTGVISVYCIKILGLANKRIAFTGDIILVSVISVASKKLSKDHMKKLRFAKGTLHRALIVRTKSYYSRDASSFIRYDKNAAILVNDSCVPLSNRIYGPISKELCIKFLAVGSIVRHMY